MDASASDAARLKQWILSNVPDTELALAQVELKSFNVSGDANLSSVGFVGQNLVLTLDQSMLTGTLAYTQSVGGEPGGFSPIFPPRGSIFRPRPIFPASRRAPRRWICRCGSMHRQ